jgi:hypothetical protein
MKNFSARLARRRQNVRPRSLMATLRGTAGAIDLASIMVGVLVLGIIGGVIAATVFAVVPWSQDNAAKQALSAVRASESVALVKGDSAVSHPGYFSAGELLTAKLLQPSPLVAVATDSGHTCYVAVAQSSTGKDYYSTSVGPNVAPFTAALTDATLGCVTDIRTMIGATTTAGSLLVSDGGTPDTSSINGVRSMYGQTALLNPGDVVTYVRTFDATVTGGNAIVAIKTIPALITPYDSPASAADTALAANLTSVATLSGTGITASGTNYVIAAGASTFALTVKITLPNNGTVGNSSGGKVDFAGMTSVASAIFGMSNVNFASSGTTIQQY